MCVQSLMLSKQLAAPTNECCHIMLQKIHHSDEISLGYEMKTLSAIQLL